ncbi:uncharacterized protein BO72DRAFT_450495 [Aspergillus fijiensis CBS 313.89]|uniref:Hydrophobin n=1 Tax=Aspergillus fijiensis CBS 313.89 TaxID=1448319 RepID=A0A8G1VWW2_9EURO|nr:uncharacterized protein BO72DRAFT_450495 [Aspergillus fijiensis CBS 313.89]RAK74611.1 hypothetical protein BO72DRAFT_450495 [Aspergillus fijiensis CBS 313.89]
MHLTTFLPVLLLSFSATTLAQKCNPNHNLKCCKVRNSLADGAVTDVTDGAGVALDPELLGTVGAECDAVSTATDCDVARGYALACCAGGSGDDAAAYCQKPIPGQTTGKAVDEASDKASDAAGEKGVEEKKR